MEQTQEKYSNIFFICVYVFVDDLNDIMLSYLMFVVQCSMTVVHLIHCVSDSEAHFPYNLKYKFDI